MSSKRGVSIGAAMKQRMGTQPQLEDGEKPIQKSPAQVLAVTSIHGIDDPLESFNTRLPRSLQRRLKIHVAISGSKIQDVVQAALDEYLQKQE